MTESLLRALQTNTYKVLLVFNNEKSMNRLFLCWVVIVLISLTACDNSHQKTIVVIGDSIATGYDLAQPWTERLREQFEVKIDNSRSANGMQTPQGLELLNALLAEQIPETLIIMLGTNDAIFGSVPVAITNLQTMARLAKQQDINVIITTLPIIERSSAYDQAADQISVAIANMEQAQVVDLRSVFRTTPDLLADGIHPNSDGQQLITDTIAAALLKSG